MADTIITNIPTTPPPAPKPAANQFDRHVRTVKVGDRSRTVHSTLTRKGMESVIASGQSVIHDGEVISSMAGLPTEDSLAIASGADDVQKRIGEKDAEIDRLKAERDALRKAATPAPVAESAPSPKK